MIGWNFPYNNDGREDGLNDPGIETFKDNPLASLAREIPQNSIDAGDEKAQKPVDVHFELVELPREKFPDAISFVKILKACEKYWKHIDSARKFFGSAIRVMQAPTIRMLKVSDYNTTGLRGPADDLMSDWFKLTKAVGASDKSSIAAGSFGIGKHAPFANSELRTVFYGTMDIDREFAFQGVSKLVTHSASKKKTQGTGYYGVKARNQPIIRPSDVDAVFKRKRVGTDVFIMGFPRTPDWVDEIAKALINSFFVAIYEERLIARVGKVLINKEHLQELVLKYEKSDRTFAAASYFQAMTSEEAHVFTEDDFEGLGRVELRVVTGKTFPKRVAMIRSGMKIWDKGHFHTPVRFAGVLLAKGEKLTALLRSLEPPMHDHWEANRSENPTTALAITKSLYGWMNERIKSLSAADDLEELDAEGMSQYLPDDSDDTPPRTDAASEGERARPVTNLPVSLRIYDASRAVATGAAKPAELGDDDGTIPATDLGEGDGVPGNGDGTSTGGDTGSGDGSSKRASKGGNPGPISRPVTLKNVRIFCSDPDSGKYQILFEPEDDGPGYLVVRVVGEVGEEPAPIKAVSLPGKKGDQLPAGPGKIGPIDFSAGNRMKVDVVLEDALHCALGVTAHAD